MKKHRSLFLITPLLFIAITCQTVLVPMNIRMDEEGISTQATSVHLDSESSYQEILTPIYSETPSFQISATSTKYITPTLSPTGTRLILSPTTQPTSLPKDLQMEMFDELWTTVNEEYLYPDFNGVDWSALYNDYLALIEKGLTNNEFYFLMDEMISRLGDDHSRYLSPQEVEMEEAEYQGNLDYVGVGILVTAVPERARGVILVVFPNSPAERAGIKARDGLLAVDDQPILDDLGHLKDIIRGMEGSQVTITIQSPGEEPRQVTMTRERISGSIPLPYTLLESPSSSRIGYIFLATFADGTIDEQMRYALEDLSASAALDGLILDNRQNSGGADTVMTPILSYFTSGTLGYFSNRDGKYPLIVEQGKDINGSLSYPLVVLIGHETVSYGEVFAGILKDTRRAYLIGETTEGNIETLWGYDFTDGSRAWIAHDTFVPYFNSDENWELSGVKPNLKMIGEWDQYTLENDPLVLAGMDYIESLNRE